MKSAKRGFFDREMFLTVQTSILFRFHSNRKLAESRVLNCSKDGAVVSINDLTLRSFCFKIDAEALSIVEHSIYKIYLGGTYCNVST